MFFRHFSAGAVDAKMMYFQKETGHHSYVKHAAGVTERKKDGRTVKLWINPFSYKLWAINYLSTP